MADSQLCSCSHVTVKNKENIEIEDLSLTIGTKRIVALISADATASNLLKTIAGMNRIEEGKIYYQGRKQTKMTLSIDFMQYVPKHLISYERMDVATFLQGLTVGNKEWLEEAVRLLAKFRIDVKTPLSLLSPEQNRIVAMIQALMKRPKLLLLDAPSYKMSLTTYGVLLKELVFLYAAGTAVVLTASAYDEVRLPCHEYVFLKEGRLQGEYVKLPPPANIVTLWGGNISSFDVQKMKIIKIKKDYYQFIYKEPDKRKLAYCLGISGCRDFNVETLSMEETLFETYERWKT